MRTETELGDSAYAARNLVEGDEQDARAAAAFRARVRAYCAPPDSDLEHDYLKDIGESPRDWRDE